MELFIRVSKYYNFKYIDEPLLISYIESDSISNNYEALIKALRVILIKHFKDFSNDRKLLAKRYFKIGIFLYLNNEVKEGKNYLIKSIKTYPLNIKLLLITFLTFFGHSAFNKV